MPSGSCLCQKLKYELTEEPQEVAICYCLSCQKISGGNHTVNVMIPEDKLRITAGLAKRCTVSHECGMNLTVHFCENCGCTLYKTADHELFAGAAIVQIGTIDDPVTLRQMKPGMELWTKYRPSWRPVLEGATQKNEF